MSENRYGNLKIGCITCKRTSKRPEEVLQRIFVYIRLKIIEGPILDAFCVERILKTYLTI